MLPFIKEIFSKFTFSIFFLFFIAVSSIFLEMLVLASVSMFVYGETVNLPNFINVILNDFLDDKNLLFWLLIICIIFLYLFKNLINYYIPTLSAKIGNFLFKNTLRSVLILKSRESESRKKFISSLELINHFATYIRALLTFAVHGFVLVLLTPFAFLFLSSDSYIPISLLVIFFGLITFFTKTILSNRSEIISKAVGPRASLLSKNISGNNEIVLNNFADSYVKETSNIDIKVRKASRDNDYVITIPRTTLDFLFLFFVIIFFNLEIDDTPAQFITIIIIAQRLMPHLQMIFVQYGRLKANAFQSRKLFEYFPDLFNTSSINYKTNLDTSTIETIEFKDISKTIEEKIINMPDFHMTLEKLALIGGESGSGKTTLLDIIAGIEKDYSGILKMNDVNIANENQAYFAAIVFYLRQDSEILFNNVSDFHEKFHIKPEITKILGVDKFSLDQPLEELSGGQLQRLYLTAALSTDKPLILMDEPTKGLNNEWLSPLVSLIKSLSSSKKLFISTHDESFRELIFESMGKKEIIEIGMKKND